jgi:hypothetical protein
MWKTKKGILLIALLVSVLLVGSIVGVVAFAQSGSGSQSQAQTQEDTLLNKVSQIYQKNTGVSLDTQQLKDAFAQAQTEMRSEALQTWLKNMVDNGKITQEQADAYLKWMQAKPDVQLPDGPGGFGGMMKGGGGHCRGGDFFAPEPDTSNTPSTATPGSTSGTGL